MITRAAGVLVLAAAALAIAAGAAARPGTDAGLGPALAGADDAAIYLAVLARHHEREPAEAARLATRLTDPDELATLLFVAGKAAKPAEAVLALRTSGKTWWEVGAKLGLPVEVWFAPLRHDPGPPFNRPYAAWRRLREAREPFPGLDDAQAHDLAVTQLLSEYFIAPVETAMAWRAGGKDARTLVAAEYRRRHGAGAPRSGRAAGG